LRTYFSYRVQRVDGICLAVKDKIRGVEINIDVAGTDVLYRTQQRRRRLLSAFEKKVLTVFKAMRGDAFKRLYRTGIFRVVRVLWHKSRMGHDVRDSEFLCKISALNKLSGAHLPVFRRHQSEGTRAVDKVPYARSGPSAPEGRYHDAVLFGAALYLLRVSVAPALRFPAYELARAQPHFRQLAEFRVDIGPVVIDKRSKGHL
jgi:hypothetical protein